MSKEEAEYIVEYKESNSRVEVNIILDKAMSPIVLKDLMEKLYINIKSRLPVNHPTHLTSYPLTPEEAFPNKPKQSTTTDPDDPRLGRGIDTEKVPQNEVYLVLSNEEKAKGFVRPVRNSYIHVGQLPSYKGIHRMLSDQEKVDLREWGYVAIMTVLTDEDGYFVGGPYVTQKELDGFLKRERIGGCGGETKMGWSIAKTYARDPKFYGATYCVHCQKHLPVNEFVWSDTDEEVGS